MQVQCYLKFSVLCFSCWYHSKLDSMRISAKKVKLYFHRNFSLTTDLNRVIDSSLAIHSGVTDYHASFSNFLDIFVHHFRTPWCAFSPSKTKIRSGTSGTRVPKVPCLCASATRRDHPRSATEFSICIILL